MLSVKMADILVTLHVLRDMFDILVTLHVLRDMFETSLSACDIPWLRICHHVALQGSLGEHLYLAEACGSSHQRAVIST